jgi:hypothetical protein
VFAAGNLARLVEGREFEAGLAVVSVSVAVTVTVIPMMVGFW